MTLIMVGTSALTAFLFHLPVFSCLAPVYGVWVWCVCVRVCVCRCVMYLVLNSFIRHGE